MQKLIVFCLALFVFCSLHSSVAGEDRTLPQSTGYGSAAPSYEEEYESQQIDYGNGGGGSNNGYGGNTPYYEEEYEQEVEEEYEEVQEEYEEEVEEYEEVQEEYEEEVEEYEEVQEEYEEEEIQEEYEEEEIEEVQEEYEEQYNNNNNHGGYVSMTPSYEEEYESSSSYYEGYQSSSSYGQNTQSSSYGYGGNPSYNNAANQTYTENYEEAYEGEGGEGGEGGSGGSGGAPNIPFVPTSLLTGFVVDIHFLAGDPRFQYIAYHYCSDLYPGYTQCDIYNGTAANSKLVATEIVVSAEIFAQLPMQERKYWHSHAFAVKSGLLVSPNTPADQDLAVMSSVMNSYGKVTDFFHSYQSFPYGGAKLAYGLGDASQINETIAQQMDEALGLSTTWQQRAEARKNLNPTVIEGADAYLTTGEYPQYVTQMFPVVTETGESGEVNNGEESNGGGNGNEETGESNNSGNGGGIPQESSTGGGSEEGGSNNETIEIFPEEGQVVIGEDNSNQ